MNISFLNEVTEVISSSVLDEMSQFQLMIMIITLMKVYEIQQKIQMKQIDVHYVMRTFTQLEKMVGSSTSSLTPALIMRDILNQQVNS